MTPSHPRLKALGNQLIDIHIRLREQLADLREGVIRPRDLRTHCLAFCSAVREHHTDEDTGTFVALAAEFPELKPVLKVLERDHGQVAEILRSIEDLFTLEDADPAVVQGELDTLAALLETHFVYEEKKLFSALNSLGSGR
ncbi:MAG TPA: hemerythrin domain-containing protein [Actinokineospora sp.]|nr:hemerythrin domain-containing protein [Actinokineospora sp.]